MTQFCAARRILAKLQDVVLHQGNLLLLRSCSENDLQGMRGGEDGNRILPVLERSSLELHRVVRRRILILCNALRHVRQAFTFGLPSLRVTRSWLLRVPASEPRSPWAIPAF